MLPRARRVVRLSALAAGTLIAGTALTGCGSADARDAKPEEKTFSISGRELVVDSDDSEVELVPGRGEGKDVKVTRWFDYWTVGGSASASWEMDGNTLKLRLHCGGISVECDAKHRIEVPRGVTVTVKDDNGAVKARGFETPLKITSDNGAIDVRDSNGTLDLRTSNGEITAKGIGAKKVTAGSSNGAIHLETNAVPDLVETDTDNGATTVVVPRSSYKVDTDSGNGGIHVRVPRDDASGHTIKARSANGAIDIRTAG